MARLTPKIKVNLKSCPVCGMVAGQHDRKLHKEAEQQNNDQGRK